MTSSDSGTTDPAYTVRKFIPLVSEFVKPCQFCEPDRKNCEQHPLAGVWRGAYLGAAALQEGLSLDLFEDRIELVGVLEAQIAAGARVVDHADVADEVQLRRGKLGHFQLE